jgi:hypothetical protein
MGRPSSAAASRDLRIVGAAQPDRGDMNHVAVSLLEHPRQEGEVLAEQQPHPAAVSGFSRSRVAAAPTAVPPEHVLTFELDVVLTQLLDRATGGELPQDRAHGHPRPPDTRRPLHPVRAAGDPLEAHAARMCDDPVRKQVVHGHKGAGAIDGLPSGSFRGRLMVSGQTLHSTASLPSEADARRDVCWCGPPSPCRVDDPPPAQVVNLAVRERLKGPPGAGLRCSGRGRCVAQPRGGRWGCRSP